LTVSAGSLALAVVTSPLADDTRTWIALKSSIASATFPSFTGFTVNLTDVTVELNQATGAYHPAGENFGALALNWGTALSTGAPVVNGVTIDFPNELLQASANVGLELGGFVFASGIVTFTSQSDVAVTDGSISLTHQDVIALSITSGHLFAGIGGSLAGTTVTDGTGLSADGVGLHFASVSPHTGPGTTYTALYLTVGTAQFTGLPSAFEVHIGGAFVKYNVTSDSTAMLDWTNAALASYGIQVDAGTSLSVGADTIALAVGGFVFISGGFSFSVLSDVAVTDGTISLAHADTMSLTISGAHFFARIGGSLTGTTYTGLSLTVGTASLTGLGSALEVHVHSAFVKFNATSDNTAKLDWTNAGLASYGVDVDAGTS